MPDPGFERSGLKEMNEMNDMTVNAPASLSGTMDVNEFIAFSETRPKGEHRDLIEGVAVMMSPAGSVHQRVASNFRDLLKRILYCEAPDDLCAVVIEPRKFWVEIYAKSCKWDPVILKRPDDVIEMPEFGLRCLVADLYRRTPLDPRWAK